MAASPLPVLVMNVSTEGVASAVAMEMVYWVECDLNLLKLILLIWLCSLKCQIKSTCIIFDIFGPVILKIKSWCDTVG